MGAKCPEILVSLHFSYNYDNYFYRSVGGKSILKRIEELPVGLEIKKILR